MVGKCTVQSNFRHSHYRIYSTSLLCCVVHCAAGIAEAELSMVCLVAEFRGFFVVRILGKQNRRDEHNSCKMESTRGVLRMETHLATCLSTTNSCCGASWQRDSQFSCCCCSLSVVVITGVLEEKILTIICLSIATFSTERF